MNKNTSNIVTGSVLIVLGTVFLISQFVRIDIGYMLSFAWPAILISVGAYLLSQNKLSSAPGWILLVLGFILIIGRFLPFSIWSLWPLILIGVGIATLLGRGNKTNTWYSESSETKINENVVFWGFEKKINSQAFEGGTISAVFGGGELDLQDAKLASGAALEINVVFGGIEVRLPQSMNVNANGAGVFGAFVNEVNNKSENTQTLNIKGSAVFGGVEIKAK